MVMANREVGEIFQGGYTSREKEKASDQTPTITIFKRRMRNGNPQKGD